MQGRERGFSYYRGYKGKVSYCYSNNIFAPYIFR